MYRVRLADMKKQDRADRQLDHSHIQVSRVECPGCGDDVEARGGKVAMCGPCHRKMVRGDQLLRMIHAEECQ